MRRSLILNILCPSGRNIIMCFIVAMIVVATIITFFLFDDMTASSVSIIYHIHSDIPHHWMTDILYKNQSQTDPPPSNPIDSSQTSVFSWLHVFDNDNNEIFVNGKSFSQIMHDKLRPSLTNLLPQTVINNTLDTNDHDNNNMNDDDNDNDDINKHLEWYTSKPIPHVLQTKLNINKHETVSTKLIYHQELQHFILAVVSRSTNKWSLDIFERDAKPFLWRYAFDTKHLYKEYKENKSQNQTKNEMNQGESVDKLNQLIESLTNMEIWNSLELTKDIIVSELKGIGIDISMGFENLNELKHILREIILKESTENPSFKNDLNAEDISQHNIEEYILKKTEFYKSYYDIHADKIKIAYTDWYHTESTEIDGVFHDKESIFKWSPNYRYLMINSYIQTENDPFNKLRSQLHLFEFEVMDHGYNESIQRMKKNGLSKRKIKHDLLDKLQDYGYYKSSVLNEIYGVKSHGIASDSQFIDGRITSMAFSNCAIYYAIQNDYKLIRVLSIHSLFDYKLNDLHCVHDDAQNINKDVDAFDVKHQSFYEYNDSMIEITKQLTPQDGVISNDVSDIMVLNDSTLLITQQIEHNAYFVSYTTSLLHIPYRYQYKEECATSLDINHRWNVMNTRVLYRDKLNSHKYYYRHSPDTMQKILNERRNEHKLDRFVGLGSFLPSIHYTSSPQFGIKEQQRKKENKLHFKPILFLSNSQNDESSIITSTPYFISINDASFDFDDTVEIVNLKSMTSFTQSALNKHGDLLAILDNTDSILVLKKKKYLKHKFTANTIEKIENIDIDEFLHNAGIHFEMGDLSSMLENETVADILSQFIKDEIYDSNQKDDVEWTVSVEFTPTSIMSHLKPMDIICISLDEEEHSPNGVAIDGYVVVLYENGVIASYVIQNNADTQYSNDASSFLSNGAIDFWLEACIDWIELLFLMSFGAYFVCSCCRRSSVRIGLGRERVINAPNNPEQRPRRGAVDVANADQLQPINNDNNNNRPPLILNDLAPNDQQPQIQQNGDGNNNENEEENMDDAQDINVDGDQNPNQRAIQAAMERFLSHNVEDEEKKEEHDHDEKTTDEQYNQAPFVRIFETQNETAENRLEHLSVNHMRNNNNSTSEDSSPLSSLSPAINRMNGPITE